MITRLFLALLLLLMGGFIWLNLPREAAAVLRLGSTTSTRDSGLLEYLLPLYQAETGVEVVVFAKGTGAAIRDGLAGRVDALLIHNEGRERALIADGFATERLPIMSNQFLIVGPKRQPAEQDLRKLLEEIAGGQKGLFLSRGDDSGTHAAEKALWDHFFNEDTSTFGRWYLETGTGMGPTLISANTNGANTMVDSATWARHGDRDKLHILNDGSRSSLMRNSYGYLKLNPEKIPSINSSLAQQFGQWLAGPPGQAAIAAYTIGGKQVFIPHTPLKP